MFQLQFVSGGYVPPFEYHVCGNITPKLGMALVRDGGKLVTATGGKKPRYISMLESDRPRDGEPIPVICAAGGILYSVATDGDFSAVQPGDKVMIGADGLTVTPVTGGQVEIVRPGGEAGEDMIVCFGE